MRWDAQRVSGVAPGPFGGSGPVAAPALPGLDAPAVRAISGLLRSVTTPEFAGITFHEVMARSALNRVPGDSPMPFRWTLNPYRGCTHACVYCFARGTHSYLELDTGAGFDSEIVVKVNLVEVLRREVSRAGWGREHVAMGTNTDPYQRAEGRYRLMPGVIRALADSGTPFSVLTKGGLLRRDLPLLHQVSADVPVGLGMSIAIWHDELHQSLEPGTPSPRARLAAVRAAREAGLPCGVFLAPVLPWLTDSDEHLDTAVGQIAAAGATGVTVVPLHLRPGAREWFFTWLRREHPRLVRRYRELYGNGAYADPDYRRRLAARVRPLLRRHGLGADDSPAGSGTEAATGAGTATLPGVNGRERVEAGQPGGGIRRVERSRSRGTGPAGIPGDAESHYPAGSLPTAAERPEPEQLRLL
ncbi:Rv2578c family radical SAM protein [Kineosporia sp. J2-2]|uniref:Rv2578c family radical SAM protein n=1 Tax=Kineosporia corallincola TaxID=2835133 RepID=A0ABS5TD07_9ACTN|nr:Rv2578c family radical SAM protein [Kineosporia corallincola]MBT0768967.1 Rv2578c family radical SAM protein [Kineosporia corallincola]